MPGIYRCRSAVEPGYETESGTDDDYDDHGPDYKTQAYRFLVSKIKRKVKHGFQDAKHSIKEHLGIDTDDSSNEEEYDDGDEDERGEQPGCLMTYSIDRGCEYTAEYVIELKEKLQATLRRLEKAKERMHLWQELHQRALEKYIFRPDLVSSTASRRTHSRPDGCPDRRKASKIPGGPRYAEPKAMGRLVADGRAWELIYAAEMKLIEAEWGCVDYEKSRTGNCEYGGRDDCSCSEDPAGVDSWEANVAMCKAELLVCEATQCPKSPGGWRYDERSGCRVWDPMRRKEDDGVRADNWGTVPEHLRPLWYGGKRYN